MNPELTSYRNNQAASGIAGAGHSPSCTWPFRLLSLQALLMGFMSKEKLADLILSHSRYSANESTSTRLFAHSMNIYPILKYLGLLI